MTDTLAQAGETGTGAGARPLPGSEHPAPRAGMARRMGAVAYEALLLTALLFVASFALLPFVSPAVVSTAVAPSLTIPALPSRIALFASLVALCAVYYVWCWTAGRRTLPQKTWHLRIVGINGEPPTRKTAFIRYLAAWVGPLCVLLAYLALVGLGAGLGRQALWFCALNFLWALVDRDRQFLHDRIAGTRVVQKG